MSSDTILTDDADVRYSYDNLKTQGWLSGHSSGLDQAAAFICERAVALFRAGKDDEASRMRRLAEDMVKELRPQMEQRTKDHAKNHPIIALRPVHRVRPVPARLVEDGDGHGWITRAKLLSKRWIIIEAE
jgi:hypothetical protein